MTKKVNQKVTYKLLDGKLCIEHHIILQQLRFHRKDKNNNHKEYYSYFIKLPKAIYDLLSPKDNLIYLKKKEDKIIVCEGIDAGAKKVKIQVDNKSLNDIPEFNTYKLSIPKSYIDDTGYERGKSYMTCRITSDNKQGYIITLLQH